MDGRRRYNFKPDEAEKVVRESKGKELDLQSSNVEALGVRALSQALCRFGGVAKLNLYLNNIGANGAIEIQNMLEQGEGKRNCLRAINLKSNSLGSEGASSIAEALRHNSTLTFLNLDSNGIGDKGAIAIAESLKVNSTVQYLSLSNNKMGRKGAKALAAALAENKSLIHLGLKGNKVKEAAVDLVSSMVKSSSFMSLDLSCNYISNRTGVKIARVLAYSRGRSLPYKTLPPSSSPSPTPSPRSTEKKSSTSESIQDSKYLQNPEQLKRDRSISPPSEKDIQGFTENLSSTSLPVSSRDSSIVSTNTPSSSSSENTAAALPMKRRINLRSNRVGLQGLIEISTAMSYSTIDNKIKMSSSRTEKSSYVDSKDRSSVEVDLLYNAPSSSAADRQLIVIELLQHLPLIPVCKIVVDYLTPHDMARMVYRSPV
mmetsp:Transcript_17889/g.26787  ORF Transcript_17889/g.26787 Transcript_17889/m.26787 type:complete len:429 (+) Transcript_17889:74-1360(+)